MTLVEGSSGVSGVMIRTRRGGGGAGTATRLVVASEGMGPVPGARQADSKSFQSCGWLALR